MPAPLSEARKRKGRPPLPDGDGRTATLAIRLRPDELEFMRRCADRRGVSLSEWVREMTLDTVTISLD